MASDNQPLTLMNIPLEVRHQIFGYVAIRDAQPEKLLRYWFEKKEVKEKTAQLAAQNPNASAPRVVYEGDQFEHEEHEEDDSEDEGDGEEDSDEDSDEESEEEEGDSDENPDEDGSESNPEEEESDEVVVEAAEQDAELDMADSNAVTVASTPTVPANTQMLTASALTSPQYTTQDQQDSATAAQDTTSAAADQYLIDLQYDLTAVMVAANAAASAAAQASTIVASSLTSAAAQTHDQDQAEDEDADADMEDDGEEHHDAHDGTAEEENAEADGEDENEGGNEDADGDSDEGMAKEDADADTAAGAVQPRPPAPVITAHRKWRHIPQFMHITHCPPPVELLLASKQLNTEAKSWFYDVAVLRIEATGSFAHTSFFEEAFSQITEAAFSPMEDIRKVEVTFVWDTTWLRSEQADCAGAIFPALLRQRAIFVTGILAQAPNLSEVTIHWHDSAQDEEAVDLMNDVLMGFLGLDAYVQVEPCYIAAEAKPYRKSIAGRRRVEFQKIVNHGLDRLF